MIEIKEDSLQSIEALWSVSWFGVEEVQARQAGRPQTGLDSFDTVGARFGLLWIQRTYGSRSDMLARRIYVLHFPPGSPVDTIMVAYASLPFIQAVATGHIPEEWVRNDPDSGAYQEVILIKVRAEAAAEIEAIRSISVNLTGDKMLDEQNIAQAKEHRTGLKEFDTLGEQFGLLWIERVYGDRQLYGLHFPLGKSVEAIIVAYAYLPFIDHASPAYSPGVIFPDDAVVRNVTGGRIKYQVNH